MKFFFLFNCLFLFTACSLHPPHIQYADNITNSFTNEIRKSENLKLWGSGGAMMDDVQEIHLKYISHERVDIAEARRMLIKNVELLLLRVNCDIKVRPYLHNYPFIPENLEFGIVFWDENDEFMQYPYISVVQLINGKIGYGRIYKHGFSDIIHSESYEEALKIVQEECLQGYTSQF